MNTDLEPLLRVRALNKRFGSFQALADIDFSLAPGEFLTLLGPSGSGKTTTLMSIAGFVSPTSGDILYQGASIIGQAPETRGFGMVFQGYALFPHMTVEQNVMFPLSIRGVDRRQARQRVAQSLERVQLGAYAGRYPRQLSGGQQQRVALARALVYQPAVLLLDEPLSALDKKLRSDLQWELRKLNKESGVSFLYVTHDQEEALSMSDRIAIFDKGRLAQIGPPTELYESPANLFVAGFLGRTNLIPGTVRHTDPDGAIIEYEGGSMQAATRGHDYAAGESVMLAIRPHKTLVDTSANPAMSATVEAVSYAGNLITYLLRTPRGTSVYAETLSGASAPLPQGARVGISFGHDAVSVMKPDA